MIIVDANNLRINEIKKILKGEPAIVSHKGKDLFAVIPLDLFTLLKALQIEDLEGEYTNSEEIISIIKKIIK